MIAMVMMMLAMLMMIMDDDGDDDDEALCINPSRLFCGGRKYHDSFVQRASMHNSILCTNPQCINITYIWKQTPDSFMH
jgi:hypothetical protein